MSRPRPAIGIIAVSLTVGAIGQGPDVARAKESANSSERDAAVEHRITDYMTRLADLGFNGGIVVQRRDQVPLVRGFGMADHSQRRTFTEKTVFPIGSVTKPITATAIMTLVDDGKLDPQDPITKFFDSVPPGKAEITVHHLLTHSSGLVPALGGDFDPQATRNWLLREAMSSPLQWPPGTRYDYSNVGYSLLAMIIEKLSGKSYEAYLKERVFDRAGMERTGYALPKFTLAELAIYYQSGAPWGTMFDRPMLEDGPCWNLRGNGGLHTTLADVQALCQALDSGRIISKESTRRALKPYIDEGYGDSWYGYGWTLYKEPDGRELWTHNGGDGGGYTAELRRYVDDGVFVFIVSSTAEFVADPIGAALSQIVFGRDVPMPPKVVPLDQASLTSLEGTYRLDNGGLMVVTAVDRGLAMKPSSQSALEALSPGAPVAPPVVQELNEKTRSCVEASARGDFTPLAEAFGGGLPLEEISKIEGQQWSEWRDALGSLKRTEIIGTAPYRMGMLATTVQLHFERGSRFVRFAWGSGQLQGIKGLEEAPATRLFPVAHDEFVSFRLGEKRHVRAAFSRTSSDDSVRIVLRGSGAPIDGTRIR